MEEALTSSINIGEVIRRRLPLGLFVGLMLAVLTFAVALGLPAIYKSRAVILIEKQDIPEDLVRSLVTTYADQRIQVISQRVLTNANLIEIINKFELYAEEREADPIERVLDKMREDIAVLPISADVVDQRSGRSSKATIAFELSFQSKTPVIAQRVTNDLVSFFLSENLKQRSEAADDTLSFLTAESEQLRTTISDIELKIAQFKEKHAESLPELSGLNNQLLNRSEQDLVALQNQVRSLEQQRVYLESELAQQEPITTVTLSETGQRILGPADRLKALESEYTTLSARYGDRHPDVITTRKEIESLRRQTGSPPPVTELTARLQELQAKFASARESYSSDHPDVRRLKREIASLEREIAQSATLARTNAAVATPTPPDNPVYIQLRARVDATSADLRSLQAQQATMREKIADYEMRLTAAPQVEREYSVLLRDYEIALAENREVQFKRQQAELAQSLESDQKGERFALIEPPVIPEDPDSPNRLAIGVLGIVLAAVGSVGTGAVAETMDSRIYGRSGLTRLTGIPPLAVIPKLENAATRRGRLRRRITLVIGVLGLIAIGILAVHFLFGPIDVLFYRVMRVLGL